MRKYLQILVEMLILLILLDGVAVAIPVAENIKGSISGKVTGETDEAIVGATVEAYSCAEHELSRSALTDSRGRYLLGSLDDGCYYIRVSRDGYESTWHGGPPLMKETIEVVVSGNQVTGLELPVTKASSVISGQVKGEDGQPLPGAWVTGVSVGGEYRSITDDRTDEEGFFAIGAYQGQYALAITRQGYVSSIYGGSVREPTLVEAIEGKTTTGIDTLLLKGGRITGQVFDVSGEGLAGIDIAIIDGIFPIATRSGRDGRFVLDGVPTGNHRIGFFDSEKNYQFQWYDGKADPTDATRVEVTAPKTVAGIKAVLKRAGGISGWVTDTAENGLQGVAVYAEPVDDQGARGMAITEENGEYTMMGLGSGKYIISMRSSNNAYLPVFFPDSSDKSKALPVVVITPNVTYGIDQILPDGIALSGRVSNPSGEPIASVYINVYPAENDSASAVGYSFTNPDGTYSVALPPGEYVAKFNDANGYLSQWNGGHFDRSKVEPISVKSEITSVLDMTLPLGGIISGTVRNRGGEGIAGVKVKATNVATGERGGYGTSTEDGTYLIKGLRTGRYGLVATGTDAGYVREKLPHSVEVGAPSETENVDFVMTQGGTIQGMVVDLEGNPLANVDVKVYDPSTWVEIADSETDEQGAYQIGGLPSENYAIRFEKNNYAVQWYADKTRREEAQQVSVVGTSTRSGVDAVLIKGVPLTGIVKNNLGTPLYDVEVGIYGEVEDEPFDEVHTGYDGSFAVPSLAPGSYRIRFGHDDHIPQWHGGQHRKEATPVIISKSEETKLSATLTMSSVKVAGKLVDTDGEDVGQAWMTVIDAATGQAVADERICECSGKFNIPLLSGQYKLRVERHGKVYWYSDNVGGGGQVLSVNGEHSGLQMIVSH